MFGPGLKIARINMGPLLPERMLSKFDPVKFWKEVERQLISHIRANIRQEVFSAAARKRLNTGFRIEMGPNSVTVVATDPAFRPLLQGQKRQQMRWLVKAQAPIPIITDEGELIFRSATPASMANGSWWHPGRKPTTVIERARDAVREHMKGQAKKLVQQQLRAAMRRSS
jgi:hypothetical protein